ncbi:hypothetical protein C8R43DRAFT_1107192 [Mycena crocata]|nr:hypothetical protein C8R43DRAFT_1107192 [Mycena crocata]
MSAVSSSMSHSELLAFRRDTVGPVLFGALFQAQLLGAIIGLVVYYLAAYKRIAKRYLVFIIFALNIADMVMIVDTTHRSINLPGGEFYLTLGTWAMWVEPGVAAVITFLAQLYHLEETRKTTKLPRVVLISWFLLLFVCLGSGLAHSISFSQVKHFSNVSVFPMMCWLLSMGFIDLYSLQLRKGSQTAVFLTGLTACVTAGLFLLAPKTTYYLFLQFIIPRLYTIRMLTALLERDCKGWKGVFTGRIDTPTAMAEIPGVCDKPEKIISIANA